MAHTKIILVIFCEPFISIMNEKHYKRLCLRNTSETKILNIQKYL